MYNMNRLTGNATMWLATGAAICIAVWITKSAVPLWFFLFPWIGHLYTYYEKKGGGDK